MAERKEATGTFGPGTVTVTVADGTSFVARSVTEATGRAFDAGWRIVAWVPMSAEGR